MARKWTFKRLRNVLSDRGINLYQGFPYVKEGHRGYYAKLNDGPVVTKTLAEMAERCGIERVELADHRR